MLRLLCLLEAIRQYSKDCHYNFKEYGQHLLADRVQENVGDYLDNIKEVCYLGRGEMPPMSFDILSGALEVLPSTSQDIKEMFKNLNGLLGKAYEEITLLDQKARAGEQNLLEGIAENLQQSMGLLSRII